MDGFLDLQSHATCLRGKHRCSAACIQLVVVSLQRTRGSNRFLASLIDPADLFAQVLDINGDLICIGLFDPLNKWVDIAAVAFGKKPLLELLSVRIEHVILSRIASQLAKLLLALSPCEFLHLLEFAIQLTNSAGCLIELLLRRFSQCLECYSLFFFLTGTLALPFKPPDLGCRCGLCNDRICQVRTRAGQPFEHWSEVRFEAIDSLLTLAQSDSGRFDLIGSLQQFGDLIEDRLNFDRSGIVGQRDVCQCVKPLSFELLELILKPLDFAGLILVLL